jgi:hypothetical protein
MLNTADMTAAVIVEQVAIVAFLNSPAKLTIAARGVASGCCLSPALACPARIDTAVCAPVVGYEIVVIAFLAGLNYAVRYTITAIRPRNGCESCEIDHNVRRS